MNIIKKSFLAVFFCLTVVSLPTKATIVEIETSLGTFRVNLFDRATPETVANFLDYLNSGQYTNSIIHRNEPNFVVQGGGFIFNGSIPLDSVVTTDPVPNEPVFSNVRGTISMAKLGGAPDSATSQWFVNLSDNSENLDVQNSGFTVFGQVIDDGMTVLDQINTLTKFNFGASLTSIPLRDYTTEDFDSQVFPDGDNFIIVTRMTIVDADIDSASDLNPLENTLLDISEPGEDPALTRRNGSLSLVWLGLLSIAAVYRRRRFS